MDGTRANEPGVGKASRPAHAAVASTLLIAALLNPLRRRLQTFIDRSFYRKRYDAREILKNFSTRLGDEMDLDALSSALVGVVGETIQPANVSGWLRTDTACEKHRTEQQRLARKTIVS